MIKLFNEVEGHTLEAIQGACCVNFTVEELYHAFIQRMTDEGLVGKPTKPTPYCAPRPYIPYDKKNK